MRALLLALLCLCPLLGEAPFPPGEFIPRVVCQAKPTLSYALYLPRAYREDRTWPVLFGFSPSGVGEEPVRLFQKAAERFGWIVVGSNDSRNGPMLPALEASDAMWKDVHARFRVDPKRSYAVGFSGGARMALSLALKHPKVFAGLVSIGAFGTGDGFLTGLGHLQFLLYGGLEDFNHWELLRGRRELQSRGWQALADRFEGGHTWAPEPLAESAIALLEVGAMRRGLVPKDLALETEIRHGLAANAANAGNSLLAQRRWQELAALFPDTSEGHLANEQAAALAAEPAVIEEGRLEERYREATQALAEARTDLGYRELLAQHIERLKASGPLEERMIRRLLGAPIARYGMALGEAYKARRWEQVLAISKSIALLDERQGWPCAYAAAALVQLGKTQEAMSFLRAAQTRGYRKPERLRALETLRPLFGNPEFEAILNAMNPGGPH